MYRWRSSCFIAPDTYTGPGNIDIDFKGKAITVRSGNPLDPNVVAGTVIDCNGSIYEPHRGFYFHSGEDTSSKLAGVTITNGYAPSVPGMMIGPITYIRGGGICCEGSSPTIRNCVFRSNVAQGRWAVGGCLLTFQGSNPILNGCYLIRNSAPFGGGIYNFSSISSLTNCAFIENSAANGAAIFLHDSNSVLANCTFLGNEARYDGGGIFLRTSSPMLTNCTFNGNPSVNHGGGLFCESGSLPTLTDCILWGDTPEEIPGGAAKVTYSDIRGSHIDS